MDAALNEGRKARKNTFLKQRTEQLVILPAVLAGLIPIPFLAVWLIQGLPFLQSPQPLHPGVFPPLAALSFLLLGLAYMLGHFYRKTKTGLLLSAMAGGIAVAGGVSGIMPSLLISALLVLAAFGTGLVLYGLRNPVAHLGLAGCGALLMAAGLMGLTVQLANFLGLAPWSGPAGLSLPLAAAFLLSGLTLAIQSFLTPARSGRQKAAIWSITAFVMFGALSIATFISMKQDQKLVIENWLSSEGQVFASLAEEALKVRLDTFSRIADRWIVADGVAEDPWRADALNHLENHPAYLAIYMLGGGQPAYAVLREDAPQGVQAAMQTVNAQIRRDAAGEPSIDRVILLQEASQLAFVRGLGGAGGADHMVVLLDLERMVSDIYAAIDTENFAFRFYAGPVLLAAMHADRPLAGEDWTVTQTINLGGYPIEMQITPTTGFVNSQQFAMAEIVLISGLLAALLIAISAFFAIRLRHIASAGQEVNKRLSKEVAERSLAQQKADLLKKRLEKVLSSVGEGIYGVDAKGQAIFCNRATEMLTGYTSEEMMGKRQHHLIHHSHADGTPYPVEECPILGAVRTRKTTTRTDEVFWRKDGSAFPVEYTVSPIVSEGNEPEGAVVVFRDITNRLKNEAIIRRSNAELDAVNKELKAFAYSVSHDLRAPLRTLDGFSLAVLEDYGDKLDKEGQKHLQRIRSAARKMGLLIDDLLQLSRLSHKELNLETVNLSRISRAIAEELKTQDPDRNVDISIEKGMTTTADDGLVTVLLQNLIGNAWKFTSRRKKARIEVGSTQQDGQRAFFVRDNGAGFDMAYAGKLFGAFQRLHDQSTFEGTGVGLATVQRIVHRHGGRVWAEAEEDKGACFYFTLDPSENTSTPKERARDKHERETDPVG